MPQVALIDDEPLVRESFARLLMSREYETVCFASSEAFLDSEDKHEHDCLVVDFRLPGMNGCELIKELRSNQIETPAILLSGNIDENIASLLRGLARVQTLNKPCLARDLFEVVETSIAAA